MGPQTTRTISGKNSRLVRRTLTPPERPCSSTTLLILPMRTPAKAWGKSPRKWAPADEQSGVFLRRTWIMNLICPRGATCSPYHWSTNLCPHSPPDSNPLDYFVWCILEREMYSRTYNTNVALNESIKDAMHNMDRVAPACGPTWRKWWPLIVVILSDLFTFLSIPHCA